MAGLITTITTNPNSPLVQTIETFTEDILIQVFMKLFPKGNLLAFSLENVSYVCKNWNKLAKETFKRSINPRESEIIRKLFSNIITGNFYQDKIKNYGQYLFGKYNKESGLFINQHLDYITQFLALNFCANDKKNLKSFNTLLLEGISEDTRTYPQSNSEL